MFTRQHYKAIAEIIKTHKHDLIVTYSTEYKGGKNAVVTNLADYFTKDNPRFNKDKFLIACGLE